MQARRVIIDTSALVYMARVGQSYPIWDILRKYFHRLLVPSEVAIEFNRGLPVAPEQMHVASAIDMGIFLEKCTDFDLFSMSLYSSLDGVDAGEAEALAQQLAVESAFIWSDDKAFKAVVSRVLPSAIVFNSLHVAALLELSGTLEDYPLFIQALHQARAIKPGSFPNYFREAGKYLGFKLSMVELRQKTDFTLLGITS